MTFVGVFKGFWKYYLIKEFNCKKQLHTQDKNNPDEKQRKK